MIKEEIGNLPGYQLLDSGDGYRLEKFGDFVLQKPDPAVLWRRSLPESEWQKADALFIKSAKEEVLFFSFYKAFQYDKYVEGTERLVIKDTLFQHFNKKNT